MHVCVHGYVYLGIYETQTPCFTKYNSSGGLIHLVKNYFNAKKERNHTSLYKPSQKYSNNGSLLLTTASFYSLGSSKIFILKKWVVQLIFKVSVFSWK